MDGSCSRANNLYTYCDLNRQANKVMGVSCAQQQQKKEHVLIHPSSKIQPKAQVLRAIDHQAIETVNWDPLTIGWPRLLGRREHVHLGEDDHQELNHGSQLQGGRKGEKSISLI